MKTKKDITKVVFRKFRDGQIIALFPGIAWNAAGDLCSYMHIGQHGPASPLLVYDTKPATEQEYKPLFDELTQYFGYVLKVCKRITRK